VNAPSPVGVSERPCLLGGARLRRAIPPVRITRLASTLAPPRHPTDRPGRIPGRARLLPSRALSALSAHDGSPQFGMMHENHKTWPPAYVVRRQDELEPRNTRNTRTGGFLRTWCALGPVRVFGVFRGLSLRCHPPRVQPNHSVEANRRPAASLEEEASSGRPSPTDAPSARGAVSPILSAFIPVHQRFPVSDGGSGPPAARQEPRPTVRMPARHSLGPLRLRVFASLR